MVLQHTFALAFLHGLSNVRPHTRIVQATMRRGTGVELRLEVTLHECKCRIAVGVRPCRVVRQSTAIDLVVPEEEL
jgi:hypothetical protein